MTSLTKNTISQVALNVSEDQAINIDFE